MKSSQSIHDVIIVGAGLSGLSAAHFIGKRAPEMQVLLLERKERVGGAIRSSRVDGYLVEHGPHGYLDNVKESQELLHDLDMDAEVQRASLKEFIRYLCLEGKLTAIPQHPAKIIKSRILPFSKKVRVLAGLWKRPEPAEQTVAEWVARRFGKSILPFADAVITGTHAGDIHKLSMDAIFPGIRKMELGSGSVIGGLIRSEEKRASKGLPAMISFRNGMETLILKLASRYSIRTQVKVDHIRRKDSHWIVKTSREELKSRRLVVATNINQALELLSPLASPPLPQVPEAHLANVVMGFRQQNAAIPHGFGFLAPQREKRFVLGVLFSTHMFPGRAPDSHALIEVLVGGRHHPDRVALGDDELVERSYEDIAQLMKLEEYPVFTKVIRTKTGIPQLEMGHLKLQAYKDRLEERFKGLFITGFGWMGIGINDMIKQAKAVADRLTIGDAEMGDTVKTKGIYF